MYRANVAETGQSGGHRQNTDELLIAAHEQLMGDGRDRGCGQGVSVESEGDFKVFISLR